MRNLAHRKFDVLWKFPLETKIHFGHAGYGLMREYQRRVLAYRWASRVMMLPFENTHIGMFSADQCLELVSHVENLLDGVEK